MNFTAIKHGLIAFVMVMVGIGVFSVATTPLAYAKGSTGCTSRFLTFPAWYDGLLDGKCNIEQPKPGKNGNGLSQFIWRIVLNIIEIALQLVAYASAGYIIYGGFRYLISTGSADKTVAARKTIMNAIIGLIISFLSIAIVTVIASRINP